MSISKNDPKLTAYVLNELSAAEAKPVADAVKNNPELQFEISRLQANLGLFKKLRPSENYRLDPARREKIFSQTQPVSLWSKYLKVAGGLAVASLALVIFVINESDLKSAASKSSFEAELAEAPKPVIPSQETMKAAPAVAKAKEQIEEKTQTIALKGAGGAAFGSGEGLGRADTGGGGQGYFAADEPGRMAAAPTAMRAKLSNSQNAGGNVSVDDAPSTLETEAYKFEVINLDKEDPFTASALLNPLFSCFENSLSRYMNYHVEVSVYWNMQEGHVKNFGSAVEKTSGAQNFTEEQRCLEPKLRETINAQPLKFNPRGKQRIRLILRSK